MSLKNYIFSSINTKGGQDSDKFATIRFKSLKGMEQKNGDGGAAVAPRPTPAATNDAPTINVTTTTLGKYMQLCKWSVSEGGILLEIKMSVKTLSICVKILSSILNLEIF